MGEILSGLSLDEATGGFVLRRNDASGTNSIMISTEEMIGLQEAISSLTDRILSQAQAKSGPIQAIAFQPVDDFGLAHESLGEHLLLTFVAPSGARRTFGLPAHVARSLAFHLPAYVAEMNGERSQPQ